MSSSCYLGRKVKLHISRSGVTCASATELIGYYYGIVKHQS
jgi:hypothetical protein